MPTTVIPVKDTVFIPAGEWRLYRLPDGRILAACPTQPPLVIEGTNVYQIVLAGEHYD